MSLHYLLDGYNVLHQMPDLPFLKLEQAREGLLRFLHEQQPQGNARNQVTIVFDGRSDIFGESLENKGIRIIFSHDESADEKIKTIVSSDKAKKSLVVVTDDREIRYFVRQVGARTSSVADFLNQARAVKERRKAMREQNEQRAGKKHLLPSALSKINSELQDIWIKKRAHGKPKDTR